MRVRLDDAPVDARSQAEVVRIDNQPPHEASLAGRQGRIYKSGANNSLLRHCAFGLVSCGICSSKSYPSRSTPVIN